MENYGVVEQIMVTLGVVVFCIIYPILLIGVAYEQLKKRRK